MPDPYPSGRGNPQDRGKGGGLNFGPTMPISRIHQPSHDK